MSGQCRRGRGRPRELRGRQPVCVTLDARTLDKLTGWCQALGLSRSEALRYLIRCAPEPSPKTENEK